MGGEATTGEIGLGKAERDALLDRFEAAWRDGKRPAIEDYLPDDPGGRRAVLPHLVHIDLELRLKAGEDVRGQHYQKRFPNLEPAELAALFAAEYALRRRGFGGSSKDYLQELLSLLPPL